MLLSGDPTKALWGVYGGLFGLTALVVLGLITLAAILSWNHLRQENKKKLGSNK